MYQTRIRKLQTLLIKEKMDYFLFADADGHFSEYVGDYFKMRTAFSGFTGSNGTLLVGQKDVYLWTDGRYFIQAQKELEGSGIELMRMGEPNVPTVTDFLAKCGDRITIGVDADFLSYKALLQFRSKFSSGVQIKICNNYLRRLLETSEDTKCYFNRIAKPVTILEKKYCDITVADKIRDVRDGIRAAAADAFLSGKLDANMWLCNIRGADIAYNPVAFSYVLITLEKAWLFVNKEVITTALLEHCESYGIVLAEYEALESVLESECAGKKVASGFTTLRAYIADAMQQKNVSWIDSDCGVSLRQAIKSAAERESLKEIYRKDSAAVCKFLYWLSLQEFGTVTEYDAARKMDQLRAQIDEFKELSFETISAYGGNAAMMHYEPASDRPIYLDGGNVFLLDSGGQYEGGTTDVTRTVAIGEVSDEIKADYTAVVRGMLALQNAHFMYGCTGMNLDILARAPIWERNLDYKCGTGHGIGFMLSVHEGPHAIRTKATLPAGETPFEAGMLVSDEPGIYKEGQYGIRIENILLCKEVCRNSDGKFMEFEPLTLVPLDSKLMNRKELSLKEQAWVDAYQNQVCQEMKPYLTEDEFYWLCRYIEPIAE